eukprot:4248776-Pyramimonas_sp.AAC.2
MRTCRIAEQDSALGRLPHHGALPQEALPLTPKGTPVHGSGTASYGGECHGLLFRLPTIIGIGIATTTVLIEEAFASDMGGGEPVRQRRRAGAKPVRPGVHWCWGNAWVRS